MFGTSKQIGSGPFGDERTTADLLGSGNEICAGLRRLAAEMSHHDAAGAAIIVAVAQRYWEKSRDQQACAINAGPG